MTMIVIRVSVPVRLLKTPLRIYQVIAQENNERGVLHQLQALNAYVDMKGQPGVDVNNAKPKRRGTK